MTIRSQIWDDKTSRRELREKSGPNGLEQVVLFRWTRWSFSVECTHSDCGGQYKSDVVRNLIRRYGLRQSMTFAGNCYDNAMAESFFGTLKSELETCQFATRQAAESTLFEYIECFYNRKRMHSSLGYSTPVEFEDQVA